MGIPRSSRAAAKRRKAAASSETLLLRIIVGDGINTNAAAARQLLACIVAEPLAPHVRYLLVVVKCASHQACLTVEAFTEGYIAKLAGGALYKRLTGTAVRLFKYILCDWFEEVCNAVERWVSKTLTVLEPVSYTHLTLPTKA